MDVRSRRGRLAAVLVAAVAVVIGATFAVRSLVGTATHHTVTAHCTVGGYDLDTDQASVAAAMVAEVYQLKITQPDRAAVLALAAALQESKLQNLAPGDGDRDSVGVLQQRPSQGWGNFQAKPLTDVTEATREFLEKLKEFSKWWTLPAAEAIQNVQISADGSLYAQHEPEATALARALLGREPAGLTCEFPAPTAVASTTAVTTQLRHELGLTTPVASAGAVTVPGAGWQTATWLVANADRYGIESVAYAGRTWSREKGWQKSAAPASAVVATMTVLKKSA